MGIPILGDIYDWVIGKLEDLKNWVVGELSVLWDAVTSWVRPLVNSIWGQIWEIYEEFRKIPGALHTWVGGRISAVKIWSKEHLGVLGDAIYAFISTVIDPLWAFFWELWSIVESKVSGLLQFIVDKIVSVKLWVQSLFANLGELATKTGAWLKNRVIEFIEALLSPIASALDDGGQAGVGDMETKLRMERLSQWD